MISLADYQRVCDERDQLKEQLDRLLELQRDGDHAWKVSYLRDTLGVDASSAHLLMKLYECRTRSLSPATLASFIPARDHAKDRTSFVKVHVRHIRQRLGPDIIETVWNGTARCHGANYRLGPDGVGLMREMLEAA